MPAQPYPPPRSWLESPDLFGKGSKFTPREALSDQDTILIRAAHLQHITARKLRQHIRDQRTSVAAVAEAIGVSDDMINDALNGRTHLHLTTLDAIAHVLNHKVRIDLIAPQGNS